MSTKRFNHDSLERRCELSIRRPNHKTTKKQKIRTELKILQKFIETTVLQPLELKFTESHRKIYIKKKCSDFLLQLRLISNGSSV